MILVGILKIFGWVLAILPEVVVRWICCLIGDIIFFTPTRLRAVLLSNLHHAFPDKPLGWRRKIGRESCRRTIETGMLVMASPFFNEERWRRLITISDSSSRFLHELVNDGSGGGGLLIGPHLTLSETMVMTPLLFAGNYTIGAIYRPFDNKSLDRWILDTRQRFGGRLVSRKKGFLEAQTLIREGGWLGVLFDQNAGNSGTLIYFLDRVASASELPSLLSRKFNAPAVIAYPYRTAFWRGKVVVQTLDYPNTPEGLTLASNQWLEDHLKSSDDACADWLWLHNRWKTQDKPRHRLRLEHKKSYLEQFQQIDGFKEHSRKTRFWIRMPNWLGDVVMALPLLKAIRAGRPDAEITVVAHKGFTPLLAQLPFIDRVIPLPEKSSPLSYFKFFWDLKHQYPDTFLLLTNSSRGDLEAWLIGCPQRFGMLRPGKWRPLLTHSWKLPLDIDETKVHQTRVWEQYLRYFGLAEPLQLAPVFRKREDAKTGMQAMKIGLICGTENQPGKRWPVARWRDLIEQLLSHDKDLHFVLFGTKNDRPITDAVAMGLPAQQVENLAGKTNLVDFLEKLQKCRLVVGNDTGGIHLANALGVPTAVVYGPTNPLRTGPVFEAPVVLLQPPGCPPEGGMPIEGVAVERVAEAALKLFKAENAQAHLNQTS